MINYNQGELGKTRRKIIMKKTPSFMIPEMNRRFSTDMEVYEQRYRASDHELLFQRAQEISRKTKKMVGDEEPVWQHFLRELFTISMERTQMGGAEETR